MKEQLEQLQAEFRKGMSEVSTLLGLEELEQRFFSRKSGLLTIIMKDLKDLSEDMRRDMGKVANDVRVELEALLTEKKRTLSREESLAQLAQEKIDITQPELPKKPHGHIHPVSQITRELEDLFTSMGFMIADGPELESEYYNFDALNIPATHPARDSQDTFFIKDFPGLVMRTHTSPVQVRTMQKYGAPLRVLVPGRCFRNESTDVRHEHTFYQLEGLVVDKGISMAHLKGILEAVAKKLYGEDTKVRLRPKFYPFVEPGVNGEVTCFLCKGNGCRVCKQSGWLEVLGAGLVHPNVLKEGGIDPKVYSGFAFGFGLTRLVMLKYGIEDIRLLQNGDMRFLEQF